MLGGRGGRKEGAATPVTDCEGRFYCEFNSRNVLFKLVITSIWLIMIQRGEETLLSSPDSVQRRNQIVAENEGCGDVCKYIELS